jgi:DNA replication protein DnaC
MDEANPKATSIPPPEPEPGEPVSFGGIGLGERHRFLMEATDEQLDARIAAAADASRERQTQARQEADWAHVVKAIGTRYADCRLPDYQVYAKGQRGAINLAVGYANDIADQVAAGRCVVLYGRPGTGKDFIVAALLRLAVLDAGLSAKWINGQDFYGRIRDAMDDGGEREAKIIGDLVQPNILAISDPVPPKDAVTAFQQSLLYRAIDGRYRNCKATWVTMNVATRAEAEQRMGAAVVDRLTQDSVAIFCDWPSYRQRKA